MNRSCACLGLLLLLALSSLTPSHAGAHATRVVSTTRVVAGPYTLDVLFYAKPQVGQPIPITIAPRPLTSDGQVLNTRPQLQATLQPSPGMSAKEIRLRVYDDPDQPSFYAVDPVVEVSGIWVLQFAVEGEAGSATGSTKLSVAGAGDSARSPAQAQAAKPTPAPSAPGLNTGLAVPIAVGLVLLLLAGWWLLRRPAPPKAAKAVPARRRK
ncbi:MAG TPA: hypothetical protein VGE04_07825 [Chloroflexia bacterium]